MDARTRRIIGAVAFATAVAALLVLLLPVPAAASTPQSWDRGRVNQVRADNGKSRVIYERVMQHRAQVYADQMAKSGVLADDDAGQRACWRIGGEAYGSNVGEGNPSYRAIQYAFEASPPHMSNIEDSDFVVVGIGVARGHGEHWLVQDYCGFNGSDTQRVNLPAPLDLG